MLSLCFLGGPGWVLGLPLPAYSRAQGVGAGIRSHQQLQPLWGAMARGGQSPSQGRVSGAWLGFLRRCYLDRCEGRFPSNSLHGLASHL